ncbi:hypothetical protein FA13DRAFT_285345 [Coprinellus micaceus]|uniref:Uncharacterized protein n=1 Tax=Coprinellus micaceus TaxID=71717 RepID=A0A4Y7TD85_COPMI|nr:hypothetical protein FA13DRAFT_285345 [Coprinellus micaceus]
MHSAPQSIVPYPLPTRSQTTIQQAWKSVLASGWVDELGYTAYGASSTSVGLSDRHPPPSARVVRSRCSGTVRWPPRSVTPQTQAAASLCDLGSPPCGVRPLETAAPAFRLDYGPGPLAAMLCVPPSGPPYRGRVGVSGAPSDQVDSCSVVLEVGGSVLPPRAPLSWASGL